ncbi:hypothetical protein ACJX0J_030638, partial [Zea mays]
MKIVFATDMSNNSWCLVINFLCQMLAGSIFGLMFSCSISEIYYRIICAIDAQYSEFSDFLFSVLTTKKPIGNCALGYYNFLTCLLLNYLLTHFNICFSPYF